MRLYTHAPAIPERGRVVSSPRGRLFVRCRAAASARLAVISNDRLLLLLTVAAAAVSVIALVYYGSRGETLAYGDARARLNIARRIVDNYQPGLTQIGNIWLPLQMLLMLPLIPFASLWHAGVPGIVISAPCFVGTVVCVYLTVHELTGSRFGAAAGALTVLANANFVYFQATPMSEPLFLFLLSCSALHLARWMRTRGYYHLVVSAAAVAAASLVRYEAWLCVAAGSAIVILFCRYQHEPWRTARSIGATYGVLACQGIVLFLLYNTVIFHSPVAFLVAPGTAEDAYRHSAGYLAGSMDATGGHLWNTLAVYGLSMFSQVGTWLCIVAGVVLVTLVLLRRPPAAVLTVLFLSTPAIFIVVSLYAGKSVIEYPSVAPHLFLNVRYGIVALPAVGVLVGLGAALVRTPGRLLIVGVVLVQALQLLHGGQPMALAEALPAWKDPANVQMRAYLHDHYDTGRLLVDFGSDYDSQIFYTDIPMRRFLHQGISVHHEYERASGLQAQQAARPSEYVRWVLLEQGTDLATSVSASTDFTQHFERVFTAGPYSIYRQP